VHLLSTLKTAAAGVLTSTFSLPTSYPSAAVNYKPTALLVIAVGKSNSTVLYYKQITLVA